MKWVKRISELVHVAGTDLTVLYKIVEDIQEYATLTPKEAF